MRNTARRRLPALWTTRLGIGDVLRKHASMLSKPFVKKGWRGNGVALRWQVAILKILAAQADGEASVSSLTRDLSILMTLKDRQLQAAPRSLPTALFVDGLIERPGKGRWRISAAGRAYLRTLESPFAEAAE